MSLTGLGVLLIGVAFLLLAIFLARVLNRLAGVLNGVSDTMESLPKQMNQLLGETGNLIHTSTQTLADTNKKLEALTPLFQIVGDLGDTTRTYSSSLVDVVDSAKTKVEQADETKRNQKIGGMYGLAALGYYTVRKRSDVKKQKPVRPRKLYVAGEQRAFDIERMKEEAKEAATTGKYVSED
ncbi:uncharacterized protein YoxC [Sporosarcina luteola]|nr:uncharacterized protein YoxC [Sporosarcina luteola]